MKTKRLFFLGIAFLSLASLTWIEEDFIFALNEKLEQHYKNYPQVKVHLFFNQDDKELFKKELQDIFYFSVEN